MKKLTIYSNAGNPDEFAYDDIAHLADMSTEAIIALCSSFGALNFYLQNAAPPVAGGGFLTIAAGWLIYKGEPCAFDAQNVAVVGGGYEAAWVPVISHRACDPQTFGDGTPRSPHIIKKVELQYLNPAALPADYVLLTDMTTFYQAVLQEPDWIEMFPSTPLSTGIGDSNPARYHIWPNGDIEFGGTFEANITGSNQVFQVPGVTLGAEKIMPTVYMASSPRFGSSGNTWIAIGLDGKLYTDHTLGAAFVNLEGIRFKMN